MFYVLLYIALCPFWFFNRVDGEERTGCFALFVSLVSRDCCVALPYDAMGLSAICDGSISLSYTLTIFEYVLH